MSAFSLEADTPPCPNGVGFGPTADMCYALAVNKSHRPGKLVFSDAREGLKAAVAKVLNGSLRRCRVDFMRNVLAHAGRQGRRVVAAFVATAFAQDDAKAARKQWRQFAD